ncbi:MAG: iron-containing alcohol dehydrogenase [Halioglobus sp.]
MALIHLLSHKCFLLLLGLVQKFLTIPSQVLFAGAGSSGQLAGHIGRLGYRRVLLVTDQILADLGMAQDISLKLEEAGVTVFLFSGVQPDPTSDIVEQGLAVLQANNCDAVLALGGGSSIDAAKGIAASATNGRVQDLVGLLKIKVPLLPLFAIPTTSGTGSEATFAAVISDSETHRKGFLADMKLIPQGVSLDPLLMIGMPQGVTAATGADALTHAIETYIGRWADERVKGLSGTATKLLFEYLPRAYRDGSDLEAREALALASYYAGQSINSASVGTVHAIAHQFGALYGTPHGLANAVVLPHVLDSYVASNAEPLAELARLIGLTAAGNDARSLAEQFVAEVRSLLATLSIEPTLAALQTSDIPQLAQDSFAENKQYPVPRFLRYEELETLLAKIVA